MAVTKLARALGEAMIRLGFSGTVDKKDHLGGLAHGNYDPEADSIPERYGFDSGETVGSLVDKRFSAEALAAVACHSSDPLGLGEDWSGDAPRVEALIQQDLWIASDFRRLCSPGASITAWDDFIEPAYKRLFGGVDPVPVPPPAPRPPSTGSNLPDPPALIGTMLSRILENWKLGPAKHDAILRIQRLWNEHVEAIAKAKP